MFNLPPDIIICPLPVFSSLFAPLESSRRRVVPSQCSGRIDGPLSVAMQQFPAQWCHSSIGEIGRSDLCFRSFGSKCGVQEKKMLESNLEQVYILKLLVCMTYRMAWKNIGGEVNLADWRMYERTAKLNSTNDVCMFVCEVLDWDWSDKL